MSGGLGGSQFLSASRLADRPHSQPGIFFSSSENFQSEWERCSTGLEKTRSVLQALMAGLEARNPAQASIYFQRRERRALVASDCEKSRELEIVGASVVCLARHGARDLLRLSSSHFDQKATSIPRIVPQKTLFEADLVQAGIDDISRFRFRDPLNSIQVRHTRIKRQRTFLACLDTF